MLEELILTGARELGIDLPEGAPGKIRAYYDLLMVRSAQFNLTAIRGEEDAARLHFVDSLALLAKYDFAGSLIDVGTGAGFPGLPLKISRPELQVTLLDSTEKKVRFLEEACAAAGADARCVHGRAEEIGLDKGFRERYDTAVSRAVARLNMLCELCLPLVKTGGALVAMKAADSDEEIREAERAVARLGGRMERVEEYTLPGTDIRRRAVIITKVSPTPAGYPRRFAKIQKNPLL